MAITQNTFTGNGSNLGPFSFTFKWLEPTDIKVSVGGVLKTAGTHYNLQNLNYTTKTGGEVLFTGGNTPASGAAIRVFRDTDDSALSSTFNSGSAIRAQDLNDNFTQNLYVTQEINNNAVQIDGSQTMVGALDMGGYQINNLAEPTVDDDAATKYYIDQRFGATNIPAHTRWRKTATAGQTTFSGTGDYGGVLAYSSLREQVYLNGALQQRSADYTADNGTSIVFSVPLTVGDVVDVVCVNNTNTSGISNAANLSYSGQFSGQTTRTVAAKLADVVSVKDFGAVGDGAADDTTAFTNARLAAASSGTPLLVPQGAYLISGTTYNSSGGLVYLNDGFTSGVNLGSASQNNQVLVVAETPNTSPLDSTASRVPISVTVVGNGANHASGVRSNLFNKSTDGAGCTGVYAYAANYSNANWGAAIYGETRHNGGTSIGLACENAAYTTNGTMIGVNVHNMTGNAENHPENNAVSNASPANSKAIQILGGATDAGLWAYGLYFNSASIKSTGVAISLDCTAAYGIDFKSGTFTNAAISLKDTQQIKFEATNAIGLGYVSGNTALEFFNGATTNLRLFNSGIVESRSDIRPITDNTARLGSSTRRFTEIHVLKHVFDASANISIQIGSGSPQGVVTAGVGSLYLNYAGGANTTLYVKESGTGNTGWVAK